MPTNVVDESMSQPEITNGSVDVPLPPVTPFVALKPESFAITIGACET